MQVVGSAISKTPDYWTQGETLEELEENLRDLYRDLINNRS
jgi:predicted RNase H-like HicB family nuclease